MLLLFPVLGSGHIQDVPIVFAPHVVHSGQVTVLSSDSYVILFWSILSSGTIRLSVPSLLPHLRG